MTAHARMRVFVDGQEMPGVVNVEFRTETIDVSSSLVSHTVHAPGERTLHITTEIPDRQRSLVDQMAEYVQRYIPEARLAFDSRPIPILVCQECRRRTDSLAEGRCRFCRRPGVDGIVPSEPIMDEVPRHRARCSYSQDCGSLAVGLGNPFCREHARRYCRGIHSSEAARQACPTCCDYEEINAERGNAAARHHYIQDPDESPARLCAECGMWPEHHNHGGYHCICQECDPDGDEQTDTSMYAERSRSDFLAEMSTDSMTVEGDGDNIERGEE